MNSGFETRISLLMQMELLCLYVKRHVQLNFHDEFMKGNDFGCDVANYHFVLTFKGITSQIEGFLLKVIANFEVLTLASAYQGYILANFKRQVIESYSQFEAITSIKLSMFYLDLFLDKISIDNSSASKLDYIKQLVGSITPLDLGNLLREILHDNKILVLGAGNIDKETTLGLSNKIK